MHKSAQQLPSYPEDNILIFQPKRNLKSQRIAQAAYSLEQQSHIFIVLLGTVIGAIFALFIAYHLKNDPMNYVFLAIIPIALAYMLRRVHIYTLTHSQT